MSQVDDLRRASSVSLDGQTEPREFTLDAFALRRPEAGHQETRFRPGRMNAPCRLQQRPQVAIELLVPRAGKQCNDAATALLLGLDKRGIELLLTQLVEIGMADVACRHATLP